MKAAEPSIDAPHPALAFGEHWDTATQAELSKKVAARMGYS